MKVHPGSAAKYLQEGVLQVDYPELDVTHVPPGVLILPALGTVLTVAMAAGIPVEVDEVDDEFAAGLDEMNATWRRLHPRFRPGFELRAARTATPTRDLDGEMLLWSGGLDSTASLIAQRERVRALFTVWGADVGLYDAALWQSLNRHFDDNPLTEGIPRIVARSNMRRFPITLAVVHDFLSPGESWWGRVQHGLALAGLAAPATVAHGVGALIRAASFSPQSNQATGSMPELDELTRWAGVGIRHEGFELTRQQKITERVAPFLSGGGRLTLAVCFRHHRHDGDRGVNCGTCEKCLRTAAGLLAAGIDPATVGLRVTADTYAAWTARLTQGLPLHSHSLQFWQEVRADISGLPPAEPAAANFMAALADDRSLVLAGPPTDRADFLRTYRAKRRAARWRRAKASATRVGRMTRRRLTAVIAG